jgi:pilus assembly protein CpaE
MQHLEMPKSASRRAVVIGPNSRMVDELQPLLQAQLAGSPASFIRSYPSPHDLAGSMGSGVPHLVFLDVNSDSEQALQLLIEVTRFGPSVQVIALLAGNQPDLILRCLRSGASDFLLQPFTAEQLRAALEKLSRLQPAGDQAPKAFAKICAVMPAKGGCGATTIASNLAFQWKRLGAKRVLLADLDPLAGTVSFLMKIKSSYSFLDVLQRSHELDTDLWRAMVTPVDGVDVLLAPELMVEGAQELSDPGPVLEYARHAYDVVILDTGSVYGNWNLNIARQANEILLVTTNELPALQAAQRALSYLDANRVGRWKMRLLVNRYHRDIGLSREVIGTALHTEVFDILPSDYEAVQKSMMDGKPTPAGTAFGKSMVQLADRLSGHAETSKKSSSFSSLLGMFNKPTK